jgi:hypothetical protein
MSDPQAVSVRYGGRMLGPSCYATLAPSGTRDFHRNRFQRKQDTEHVWNTRKMASILEESQKPSSKTEEPENPTRLKGMSLALPPIFSYLLRPYPPSRHGCAVEEKKARIAGEDQFVAMPYSKKWREARSSPHPDGECQTSLRREEGRR